MTFFYSLGAVPGWKYVPLSDSTQIIPFFDGNVTERASTLSRPGRSSSQGLGQARQGLFLCSVSILSSWKGHSAPCTAKLRTIDSRDRLLLPLCLLPKKDADMGVPDLQALKSSPESPMHRCVPVWRDCVRQGLSCQLH